MRTRITVFVFLWLMGINSFSQEISTNSAPDTPDRLLAYMVKTFNSDVADLSPLREHQTEIGKQVWDWLILQKWFKGRESGRILERKQEGGRYELVMLYEFPDGNEKISVVFFNENGILKFHDIFLFEMKGNHFDMFLSYIIKEPKKAQVLFCFKNPSICADAAISGTKGFVDYVDNVFQHVSESVFKIKN